MKLLTSLLVIWGCLVVGCMTVNGGYSYSMIVVNTGTEIMHAIHIQSMNTEWGDYGPHSILIPFAQSVHRGPIPAPPNGRFVYSWRDAKGGEHREEIDMKGKVGRLFQGEIVFIVDGNNTLTVKTYDQRGGYRMPPKTKQ